MPNPQLDLTDFDFGDPAQIDGIEFFDFEEVSPGNFQILWKLTKPEAFIRTKVFDDTLAEPDTTFTVSLLPGEGYRLDPNASSLTIAVTDGVPGTGGPRVGFSVDKTALNEGDQFTITFTAAGTIPADGLRVFVDSDIFGILGQFEIFDDAGEFAPEFTGLRGLPQGNEDASGFSVVMTGNTATLTLKVFRDDVAEAPRSIAFNLADGENYDVQPNANQVTLTLSDLSSTPQTLFGTPGDDTLVGGEGNNIFYAGEGNNIIESGAGNDIVYAGAGNDVIRVRGGNNTVYAGEGNNSISSGAGDDLIYAGAGNDVIRAGDGRNTIYAGEGNNTITTGAGDDLIYAGAGNDVITTGAGNDLIYAGEGNNQINAGTGNDQVYSGHGSDVFTLNRGDGFVTIYGFNDADKFALGTGLSANDLTLSRCGCDTIISAGDDQLAVLKWTHINQINLA